jgi:hypothetical protein
MGNPKRVVSAVLFSGFAADELIEHRSKRLREHIIRQHKHPHLYFMAPMVKVALANSFLLQEAKSSLCCVFPLD